MRNFQTYFIYEYDEYFKENPSEVNATSPYW